MNRPRIRLLSLVARDAARPAAPRAGVRTARRLAVVLVLLLGGLARAGSAGAAFVPTFYIQVSPVETTLLQFTAMDITAGGAGAGQQLTVTLQGTVIAESTAGQNGSLALTGVTVPATVASCGDDTVNLLSNGSVAATTSVRVYCPAVQITPDPLDSGGGRAQFTVTGEGFPQQRDVTLALDNAGGSFADVGTDANGAFAKSADLPQLACGSHLLTATGASGQVVIQAERPAAVDPYPELPTSATFTVTGCAPPVLAANPSVFDDGTLTHVTGSGFSPGQPVTLTWQDRSGRSVTPCSPTADPAPPPTADASGAIDTFCFAPPHQIFGAAQIMATQTTTRGTQQAAAPVVVESGSMQPSEGDQFVFRH
jgi:hypothetical protein